MEPDIEKTEVEMIEHFVDLQGQKVLEIGCGEGRISMMLAHKPKIFTGIDPDEVSIDKAKSEIPNTDFRIGSGEALEFEDGSFSIVLFTLSLHHQNSRLALKEAIRVLTDDGHLIVMEPTADSEATQFYNLFDDETERLLATLKVVENCDLEIENKETFFTIMSFKDLDELFDYDFCREKIQAEDRNLMSELVQKLKGSVATDQAIQLRDDIHVFSLRKKHS
jgi:ubiquinone/menaquinone biosynthesis C-methylase UbiE